MRRSNRRARVVGLGGEILVKSFVSDPAKDVLTAYGAYGEKQLYGKTVVGVIRSTFLIDETGAEHVFEGECKGALLDEPRGGAGFGYDPLFVPDGHAQSYAELGDEVKGRLSHRARAWTGLSAWWRGRGDAR